MTNGIPDQVCAFCARWHPDLKYSYLIGDWAGKKCVADFLEKDLDDANASLFAEEFGLTIAADAPVEATCDFCGSGKAIDEIGDNKICAECLKKIQY